jgi:hypothetical protein
MANISAVILMIAPLSQVAFIHDYVELAFGNARLSIYNEVSVLTSSGVYVQGEVGFCDALVQLIDQRAKESANPEGAVLALEFEQGSRLHVRAGDASSGPEAFQFVGASGVIVVEQNA